MPPVFAAVAALSSIVLPAVPLTSVAAFGAAELISFGSAAGFASITAGGLALGGPLGSLLLAGAAIGLQYALTPKQRAAALAAGEAPSYMVRQTAAPAQVAVGEIATSGPLFFAECKPPWLYLGIVLSVGEVDSLQKVLLANEYVTFDPVTFNARTAGYTDNCYCSFLPGTMSQGVDPILAADFPDLSANFRTPGFATIVLKMKRQSNDDAQTKLFGSSVPSPLAVVRGIKVWDPRDAFQDKDDSSTWKWSRNAALIQAWYFNWRYGNNVPWADIDTAALRQAADECDRQRGLAAGGSEAQFCADGVINCDTDPYNVVNALLTASAGSIGLTGASDFRYEVRTGDHYADPVMTLTESDMRGTMSFSLLRETRDLINTVRSRFVVPERQYQIDTGPAISNDDYVAADGQVNEATLDLAYTKSVTVAQRLSKRAMEESRSQRKFSAPFSLRALRLTEGDIFNFHGDRYAAVSGRYRVVKIEFDEMYSGLKIDAQEIDPAALVWVPSVDEKPFTIAVDDLSGVN